MRLELEWDGSEDELIEFIDFMSDEGLDSKDIGDAMGWIITETMANDCELKMKSNQGPTLVATIIFDLFEWRGI